MNEKNNIVKENIFLESAYGNKRFHMGGDNLLRITNQRNQDRIIVLENELKQKDDIIFKIKQREN